MNLPVEWGDVPAWLQAAAGLGQVGQAVRVHRLTGAQVFADRLREELGSEDGDLAEQVVTHAELGDLVLDGLEGAMRTQDHQKRWLLAKVVAAAFAGDNDARFDEAAIFLRTARALEPPDVRALVQIAETRPDSLSNTVMVGAIRESDLVAQLSADQRHFLKPILATLVREGLVWDETAAIYDQTEPAWSATAYGFGFLRYLPERLSGEMDRATLAAFYRQPHVVLKNLGPGPAKLEWLGVSCDDDELIPARPIKASIAPGSRIEIQVHRSVPIPQAGGARIVARWTDGTGQEQSLERIQWKRDMPGEVLTSG